MNKICRLEFLENRNYLHSTTIIEEIINQYGDIHDISLKIGKIITTRDVVFIDKLHNNEMIDVSAYIVFRSINDVIFKIGINPVVEGAQKNNNYSTGVYNEKSITNNAVIHGLSIFFNQEVDYSFIKVVNALNSFLLSEKGYCCDSSSKWYFIRMNLDKIPSYPYKIRMDVVTKNNKLRVVKTDMYNYGEKIGEIYFACN